ncbi:TetR/AcrR family transcriptional regulator [Thermodesulfobacteriota bacterium]
MVRPKKSTSQFTERAPDKIIEVAIDLFSRYGFKGTSIRQIAKASGLTTSTLYYYFGTKGGLLAAIEAHTIKPMMLELRKVYALELPALDRLALLLKTHLTYIGTHQKESRIFFLNEEFLPTSNKDFNKKHQREIFIMYRAEVERVLFAVGRKKDSTVATFCTFGVMMWLLRWYRSEGRFSMEDVINKIIQYVLCAITGDVSQSDTTTSSAGMASQREYASPP